MKNAGSVAPNVSRIEPPQGRGRTSSSPGLRLPVLFYMLAAAAIAGCDAPEAGQEARYDGETLFRGLVFQRGEVADLIPEIRNGIRLDERIQNHQLVAHIESFQDELVAIIDQLDPTYFERFASQIQDGDHVMVADALRETGELIEQALSQMPAVIEARERLAADPALKQKAHDMMARLLAAREADPDLKPEDVLRLYAAAGAPERSGVQREDEGACVAVFVVAIVAGNVVYVVNVAAAWNVAMAANFTVASNYTSTDPNAVGDLRGEMLINSIVDTL